MKVFVLSLSIVGQLGRFGVSSAQCIADEGLNAAFAQIVNGDDDSTSYSIEGTCCQEKLCGLGCPEEVEPPTSGK